MNFEALHRYLTFLWVPGPETLFAGIQKLPPGHYLLWQQGVQTIQQYWDPAFLENSAVDERETVEELRSILRRSVERHLISDVPLGVFLSGGIDSSTILALATEIQGQPLTAYTIAFRDSDSPWEQSTDDARYARQVARHFRADFHEITAEPDMVELLPKVVLHLDEPVADPAAILTYLICDAARPQLKVLLSGQGGDEIFAGYRVHLTHALGNALRHIPRPVRNGVGRSALALLQRWKQKIPGVRVGLAMAAHRFLEKTLRGTDLPPEERYVFNRSYFTDRELLDLYSPELRQHLQGTVAGEKHLAYFERVPNQDFINRMLYVDQKTFLPELNLTYSDKLSAAVSVEIRVPFLDAELVEFVAQIPARWKLKGTTSKYILKAAMKSTLTPDVIRRRKASFGAPIRSWLRRDLREMVDELLSERSLRLRGLFDPGRIRSLIEQDRAGHEDHAYRIWTFLTLELWNRTFLDAGGYPGAKAEPTLSAAALTNRHL
jgi:asparagine synthase (glutamine-hydrolysing)